MMHDNMRIITKLLIQIIVTNHAKGDLMGIAKSIDHGQPAQSGQSDHGRNISLLTDFLGMK